MEPRAIETVFFMTYSILFWDPVFFELYFSRFSVHLGVPCFIETKLS